GAEQEHRTADADPVPGPQPPDLHRVAVDPGAVGAFQVGQDDVAVVMLDLGVKAANPFIVEPEQVALLAADRQGDGQLAEDAALVDSLEHLESYVLHCWPHDKTRSPEEL